MTPSDNMQILYEQSPLSSDFFSNVIPFISDIYYKVVDPNLWNTLLIISSFLSIIFIGVSVYSLVKMRELQIEEKEELREAIEEIEKKRESLEKKENSKWSYVLSLLEGYNDSDWRMSIIEADSLMEEFLREKEVSGNSVSELLEGAKTNGYKNINDAWNAHIVRNKIAHEGSNYPISQMEARKIIKMYQNFFEELEMI